MPTITISGCVCEHCNVVFAPRVAFQRFCCRTCSDGYWSAQRREAMAAWRQQRQQEEATA
jgi:hypothetical protein